MPANKEQLVREAVEAVTRLMAAAATTAPKSKGFDDLTVEIVSGKDLRRLAEEIRKMWREQFTSGTFWFLGPDASAVEECTALFLLGIRAQRPPLALDCQACGYETCEEYEEAVRQNKISTLCSFKVLDLGLALSSAVMVAAQNFIDNRIMWSAGMAAKRLGLIEGDLVMGIPLSARGSNPFFDRYLRYFLNKARSQQKSLTQILREHGIEY
ncbi:MAG: ferredoxin domain-containing protein [Promethearchaeota archaeon]